MSGANAARLLAIRLLAFTAHSATVLKKERGKRDGVRVDLVGAATAALALGSALSACSGQERKSTDPIYALGSKHATTLTTSLSSTWHRRGRSSALSTCSRLIQTEDDM
jgi:hypothetical protein